MSTLSSTIYYRLKTMKNLPYCDDCHNEWIACVCMDGEEEIIIEPLSLRELDLSYIEDGEYEEEIMEITPPPMCKLQEELLQDDLEWIRVRAGINQDLLGSIVEGKDETE